MDDFYATLGVPPNAASGEIKSRYRFLSHAYHPDKFSSDAHKRDAEEAFKKINEAFQTLSNPGLRADYDRRRADSSTHGTGHSTPRHSPANSTSPRWAFTGLLNPALTTALVIGIVILSYAVLRVRKATKSPGDAQQAVAFVPGAIDGPPLTLSERSSQPVSKSQLSDDATALFDFGKGKEASGHFLEALAAYKRCLNLAPQDLDVVMTVGQCAERLGRYDEAVEAYSRATRTGGGAGLPGVWLSLARNAKNAGRQELAERAFGTVQRIESELSEKTGEQTKNQVIAASEEEIATLKTPAEKSDAHNQERQTFIETKAKAEKGDFQSQKGLVWMYHYGAGTSEDDAESFRWSLKLAAQGDAEEQCNVGDCYRQGKGVVKNYVEAMKWFLKAAEQGSVNGQELVGDMYSEGEGVAENHANAFNWILKAALNWQEGLEMCQVRRKIADAFYKGDGVPKDLIEAYAWFSVVAERVKYKYQEALSVLDPAKHPPAAQMRDKLEKSFTAKEIALAQARALELSAQVSAIDKEGATKAKRP